MPMYNTGGPAEYAQNQQGRQDDQFRQILQMMMMGMQQKQQQGQYADQMKQQQLENQMKTEQLDISRQRGQDYGDYTRAQTELMKNPTPPKPSAFMEKLQAGMKMGMDQKGATMFAAGLKTTEQIFEESKARQLGTNAGGGGQSKLPASYRNPLVDKVSRGLESFVSDYMKSKSSALFSEFDPQNDPFVQLAGHAQQKLAAEFTNPNLTPKQQKEFTTLANAPVLGLIAKATEGDASALAKLRTLFQVNKDGFLEVPGFEGMLKVTQVQK